MRALTIFFLSLFSLPLVLNAQSVDEMLQKVSAAIESGQHGQAVSYFRQTIGLDIDRTEMFYWTSLDKSSDISSKLAVLRYKCAVGRKRRLCVCMKRFCSWMRIIWLLIYS